MLGPEVIRLGQTCTEREKIFFLTKSRETGRWIFFLIEVKSGQGLLWRGESFLFGKMSVVANNHHHRRHRHQEKSTLLSLLDVTAEPNDDMQEVIAGFDCDLIPSGFDEGFVKPQGGESVSLPEKDRLPENDEFQYKPLYLEIALGAASGEIPAESWVDEHVTHLTGRLSKRVFPAFGCAETMRKVTENATGRENVRRVIQCTGEPLLAQYAHPPPAEYAKKVEQTTKALFDRLRDQTKVIKSLVVSASLSGAVTRTDLPFREDGADDEYAGLNLQNKLAEITSLLFGQMLWEMRQLAQVATRMHMTTVRVPRKIAGKDLSFS